MPACVACREPLTLLIECHEQDEDEPIEPASPKPETLVDDDVFLQCGCHFHWQCLLDAYSMSECPNCGGTLMSTSPTGEQQLLCDLKNEGGLQSNLDILPLLTEECYLKTFPEERKCQAFLEFCGEGDVEAIIDLLGDDEGNDENGIEGSTPSSTDVLRYQDQIRSMGSGLHLAVQNQKPEVAWLLLLLASTMDIAQFPPEVMDAAQRLGLVRENQARKTDIRTLQDADGMTAEQRAAAIGGIWDEWLRSGRLRGPGP